MTLNLFRKFWNELDTSFILELTMEAVKEWGILFLSQLCTKLHIQSTTRAAGRPPTTEQCSIVAWTETNGGDKPAALT